MRRYYRRSALGGAISDRYDLVIIGLGAAGLAAARAAAKLELAVAAVERDRPGGTPTWTGDLPARALGAAAAAAHAQRAADRFGLPRVDPEIDLDAVWQRVRRLVAERAPRLDEDGSEAFEVVHGTATVTGPQQVTVDGDRVLETSVILIATGSRPVVPDVPGLRDAGFLTTDDLFALDQLPRSLVILGAGHLGVELAQALHRLGVSVTVVERELGILPGEEPALAARLAATLRDEGVTLLTGRQPLAVERRGDRRVVRLEGEPAEVEAAAVLVVAGRRPNVEGLGLEDLGITVSEDGVAADRRGRTSVPTIYVAGDVHGRVGSTSVARYEALATVRDAFFPLWSNRADQFAWCTFTDPELAHAGLTIAEAEARYGEEVDVFRADLTTTERAHIDGATGAAVVVTAKGRVVGAHLLAPHASEAIHELALAIRQGLRLTDLATLAHVEPTYAAVFDHLATEVAIERAHRLRWLARRNR